MRYRSRFRFILEGTEGLVVLAGVVCTWPIAKRWLENWGSSQRERQGPWPGDQLVSGDYRGYTRAIVVAAPAGAVWPWIVQFGLGRAGFYSYELLERIVGIPVTNVESIEPTMQSLAVGDTIGLHPKAPGILVEAIETGRHVCFGAHHGGAGVGRPDPTRSWSIYVVPVSREECRLLLRGCVEQLSEPSWTQRLGNALEEPIDFVMEQRMLRTIKRLAELSWQ